MSEKNVPDKETLTKWLEEEPTLTRKQIADRQFELTGMRPSLPAISMAFERYGLRRRSGEGGGGGGGGRGGGEAGLRNRRERRRGGERGAARAGGGGAAGGRVLPRRRAGAVPVPPTS